MRKILAIQLSDNGALFSSTENDVVTERSYCSFRDKIDYRYKEQLESFFQEKKYKDFSFDEVVLSWYSPISTLVPNNVFSETKPEDIITLCYQKNISPSNIDYNRIPELAIVNIYEIPLWVKSFFVIKYPRITIQQEGTFLLREIFKGATFTLHIFLVIHQGNFRLVITQKNELLFYSDFSYLNSDDIIYHLSFVLQQKNLLGESGKITVCNGLEADETILSELENKLSRITDYKNLNTSINSQFIINSLLKCV